MPSTSIERWEFLLEKYTQKIGNNYTKTGLCRAIRLLEREGINTYTDTIRMYRTLMRCRPAGKFVEGYWWTPGSRRPRAKLIRQIIRLLKGKL